MGRDNSFSKGYNTDVEYIQYFEVLDRLAVIQDQLDYHILQHLVVGKNEKLHKQLKKAQQRLSKAYQIVGQLMEESRNKDNVCH